jgi:hypothetical protein
MKEIQIKVLIVRHVCMAACPAERLTLQKPKEEARS